MSTLYGADALAGVVNIITRRPTRKWTGSTSVSGLFQGDSEFGGEHANARLSWRPTAELTTFPGAQYRRERFRPANFHEPHRSGCGCR